MSEGTNKINNTYEEKTNLEKMLKSLYIIKYIFSFLYENKKLDLIIHNKSFQNKLNIDLEYYKEISGKYKIAEGDKKGKEYKLGTNILIFEGEYKNGKRNGKGKEYYKNGKLKFQGEYLKGKRWSGKGYNIDGEIILELENGKGKEYYKKDKLKFEGEFFGEKMWNGKIYNYQGKEEFVIINGKGYIKEYNNEGKLLYEGEYLNGERNGKGKEYFLKTKLIFNRNKYFNPINISRNEFPFSQFSPFQILSNYPRFSYYNCFYNPNLDIDYNLYKESKKKIKFEGEYLNGKRWNGKGYNFKGEEEFEIKDGKGYIKEYNDNNELIIEGEYKNGMIYGKGKEYNKEGKLIFEGEYKYGERNEKGKE